MPPSRLPRAAVPATALVLLCAAAGPASGGAGLPFAPGSTTLVAAADAYVEADTPTTNYGASTKLRIDGSPDTRTYLRFDLSGLSAPVLSASLQLMPTSSLAAGFEVHGVADSSWVESGASGVTYATAPAADPTPAATSGAVVSGTRTAVDATSLVQAAEGRQLSVALLPLSTTALALASRETTTPPQLVVVTDPNLAPPRNTAPPQVSDQAGNDPPQSFDTLAASPGTWSPPATGFDYQWQDCTPSLSSCTAVGGDAATYQLGSGDLGFAVRVVVTARNAAGTGAPATSAATAPVVPPPARQTLTLTAAADAYVAADGPTTNHGTATKLRVDQSPDTRSYVEFDLTGIDAPVVSAVLELQPTATLSAGFDVHAVADSSWIEHGTGSITYDDAPAFDPATIATSGPVSLGQEVDVDVTPAIPAAHGPTTVALTARSTTALTFASRETATPPLLVLIVDRSLTPPANVTPPQVSDQQGNDPPLSGDQLAADPGTWTNSPSSFHYAWQRCTPDLGSCVPAGVDDAVYGLGPADVGAVLRVKVTAVNAAGSASKTSAPSGVVAAPNLGHDPVLMAAGDIACGSASASATCDQVQTSDLILAAHPDLVLPLGDDQYECGSLADFQSSYDPSWGRLRGISRPVSGNHEYTTSSNPTNPCYGAPTGAPGYYTYFGSAASPLDAGCSVSCKGYYSYDVGSWHVVALNSNCARVGDCNPADPQLTWLHSDLAAHAGQCILAYWHHPRFTSGQELDSTFTGPIVSALYAAHADVILNGHDHDYERFAPLDPNGAVDPANGIREFVVGTGGRNLTSFVGTHAGSELRDSSTFGALRLTLHATSYDWQFVPVPGGALADSGSQPCHVAAGADTTPPTAPTGTVATAATSSRVEVTWQPATDNVRVVAYRVYRNGALVRTVGAVRGWADTAASPGTSYSYTVRAVDASGNASPAGTAAAAVTPPAEPAPPLFADGFDTDTLDAWTNVSGAAPVAGGAAGTPFAARIRTTGAAVNAYDQLSSPVAELTLSARLELVSQSTTANVVRLRTAAAAGGSSSALVTVFVSSSGKLGYRNETTATSLTSSTAVSPGVWHTLVLHVRVGASGAGLVETTLDGVRIAALSGAASLGTTPIGRIQIGDSSTGHTFDASVDGVVASPAG